MNRAQLRNPACGLIIVLLTLAIAGCSRSEFERLHERAILQNPAGVEMEIHTGGGKKQFALSEPVAIEEFYTSQHSGAWHIEVLEGWNGASDAAVDVLHITDGKTIWDEPRQPHSVIICCESRHVWLSLEPTRIPFKQSESNLLGVKNPEWLTLRLPNKPGKYRLYLTTQRVFGRGDNTKTYMGKGLPVSSNILNLEVK